MKLPRITIRKLMILVAVAATILWCTKMVQYSRQFRQSARQHQDFEQLYSVVAEGGDSWAGSMDGYRKKALHHAALRAKYERAARYPWIPVTPDPPEPR